MKLTNRTILITGGSAGIGLAFALKFLELGNRVLVTGRRQAVLDDVKAKHPALHAMRVPDRLWKILFYVSVCHGNLWEAVG